MRVEIVPSDSPDAAVRLRRAVEAWISRHAEQGERESSSASPEIVVTVRELDAWESSTSAGQVGSCEPLRQWFALHEVLEIARHRATLEKLEAALRAQAQVVLASSSSWRALAAASRGEASTVSDSGALARCQTAAASLYDRLEACIDDAAACVDTPMVSLDRAVKLTRVDPWYPDRETCLRILDPSAEAFEGLIADLAGRAVEVVAAEPTLGALDRMARMRTLFEAVEDLCVPRRRSVRTREVEELNGLLDKYGALYGVAAARAPAMERSEGVVYAAGRGTLMELGKTRPTSAARQLEGFVLEFRAVSERLGHCEATGGHPLEVTVAGDGVEVLRTELFPEQLLCDVDALHPSQGL